jgi:glycosyltransferase involved in cell wall biosynthesis
LTVTGDEPLRERIEADAQSLGIAEQVTFTGGLDDCALMQRVAAADIVLVPARFEGLGLTAPEAMALVRAIIAARSGGLPEVIGDAGVLVPRCDPAALMQAIAEPVDDPARRTTLGHLARCRAKEHFSLPVIADKYLSTYSALAGRE